MTTRVDVRIDTLVLRSPADDAALRGALVAALVARGVAPELGAVLSARVVVAARDAVPR
jgi:hypothetical protein